MPELPEVETIRRDLNRVLRGKTIAKVTVRLPKIVRGNHRAFTRALAGKMFGPIKRRGKLLLFTLASDDRVVLLHLKMTGQLLYSDGQGLIAGGHSWPPPHTIGAPGTKQALLPNQYTHVIFTFTDGSHLYFNDLRQFGYVELANPQRVADVKDQFGVEPLTVAFTPEYLAQVVRGRTVTVKQVLLDQAKIAGLGNIYVDEALFFAGVRPTRRATTLTVAEVRQLHRGIQHVLRQSIKHRGTTFNSYRDVRGKRGSFVGRLKVYGRSEQSCRRCRGTIMKVKVGGRGTHFCPECQA